MTNTEKPTTKQEEKKKGITNIPKKTNTNQHLPKKETKKPVETDAKKKVKEEVKKDVKKDKKKEEPAKPKKTEAVVRADNLHLSTKTSSAICKFIKHKKIQDAIDDLEQVVALKKAVPMKGEIPHRKGKMMSGRFPKKSAQGFITLLKSLEANANVNELENPIIVEAIANIGSRPYGKFGRVRKKRSHIQIKVKEKLKK